MVKAPAKAGADAEARAEKAAQREAAEHRREFVAALLAGRISKADVLALVLPNYLDDANANEQAAIAKLLRGGAGRGRPLRPVGGGAPGVRSQLGDVPAVGLPGLLDRPGRGRADGGRAHERAERHRAFLAAKGYEPTAYEAEQAEHAARRHEGSIETGAYVSAAGAVLLVIGGIQAAYTGQPEARR